MKIGAVVEATGTPASTIRYYERRGLIGPIPRTNGVRDFDKYSVQTLRLIRLAQMAGFSIRDIQKLLAERAASRTHFRHWRAHASARREAIASEILALQHQDALLAELERCTCDTAAECLTHVAVRKHPGTVARAGP